MTLVLSPSEIVSKLEKIGELGLLGKAPNWSRRLLGEVINVQNGAPFSSDKFNREGTGMPLIRIRDVGASETSTYFDGEYDPAFVVRAGDLLVGMDGDFRCARWTSEDALLNQRVCRLTVKSSELDERFLFLILQGYLEAIWKETSATTVKHLSSKSIQEIPLPLPSINEQHRIVELLEGHLSRLDVALADVKQAKIKAAQFRRSLLQAAFTGNLDSGETNLKAGLPEGWAINRLEDLCEPGKQAIVDGPFGSNLKRSDYVDSGIPVLKIQNIKENSITLKKMDFVLPEKYNELLRHSFTEGDIVMTKLGDPLGVSAIVSGIPNGLIVADLVRIRPTKVLTKFLCYQLNSPRIQKHINDQQKGTTRPRVNLAMIRELPIYAPPIQEQYRIIELLEDHLSRLEASVLLADAIERQSNSLKRSLLQAAFMGQLTKEVVSV